MRKREGESGRGITNERGTRKRRDRIRKEGRGGGGEREVESWGANRGSQRRLR